MAYTEIDAKRLYEACQRALIVPKKDKNESVWVSIQNIAALAHAADKYGQLVSISSEEFSLIAAYW